MTDPAFARLEARLARVERQNRILAGLLLAALAVASIAVTEAAPNVVTADEVRAHRFTLIDPQGGVADNWYAFATNLPAAASFDRRVPPGYSGWAYHSP